MATLAMPLAAQPEMQPQPQLPAVLSETGLAALESLIKSCMRDDQSGRRSEVRQAWKQRAFKNGQQQLYYDYGTYSYMDIEASGRELPQFRSVYNIFTPHWRSFVSILSQNPPGINFEPDELSRSVDVTAAAYAEKMRHRVDKIVHMKDRQADISSFFCTDGRTITRTYVDEQGKLRIEVGGVLEWKVPIYVAPELAEWGYAINSREVNRWKAKAAYSDFASKIEGIDSSEGSYERMARLGILANKRGGHADALKNLTTRHTVWIRPFMYGSEQVPDAAKEEFTWLYPNGLRATVFSGNVVDCVPENMDTALKVGWPAPGQGQVRPSLLHDLTAIQEDFNDYMNMLREHIEFSIPATWVTDTVDEEALAEQRSAPATIHTITVPQGASITDLVMQEEVSQLPPDLVANIDRLLSLAQFTTGDLPSLSGEGDPHSETATGQKMLSDQAKGQLSPAWQGLQWIMAGTYELAVRKEAANLAGRSSVSVSGGPTGQQQFNPQAILDGEFGCYPDTDSSFPETQADKRGAYNAITERLGAAGPEGVAIIMHPDNLTLGVQLNGLSDFVIPQVEARNKQLEEIEQLLQETPVPDESKMPQWEQAALQAKQMGQQVPPPPMKSSIDIDQRDFDEWELAKGRAWLSSRACREEKLKGNLAGIQNVNLHLDQHEQRIAQVAQANAPKPEPPKVSLTAQVSDPNAIAQLLGDVGVQTTPQAVQASTAPQAQETQSKTELNVAKTQHAASQAQHVSVLAAREAVTPIDRSPTPDELSGKEK